MSPNAPIDPKPAAAMSLPRSGEPADGVPGNAPDAASQQLRDAHALQDERPADSVRTAVLYAARQQMHLRARNAARPARARTGRWIDAMTALAGWRPSLPVTASLAVGALALAVTVQFERDSPGADRQVSAAAGPSAASPAAPLPGAPAPVPPAASVSSAPEPVSSATSLSSAPAPVAPAASLPSALAPGSAATGPAQEAPSNLARRAPAPAAAAAARESSAADTFASQAGSKPAAALPAPGLATPAIGAPPVREGTAFSGAPPAPASTRPAATARAAASAPSAADAAPERTVLPTAREWLRRIIALRSAHDDAAADRELGRFVQAYPEVTIPPEAQRL